MYSKSSLDFKFMTRLYSDCRPVNIILPYVILIDDEHLLTEPKHHQANTHTQ